MSVRSTQMTSTSLSYTPFDKPSVIANSVKGVTSYAYTADQARAEKVAADGTQTFYAGGLFEQRRGPKGAMSWTYYVQGPEGVVAIVQRRPSRGTTFTDKTYYVHKDHLGSTDVLSDEAGAVAERRSYDPFGLRRRAQWGSTGNLPAEKTKVGYTGHEDEEDLGLINMGGRIYDPRTARMLTPDPAFDPSNAQTLNVYSYVWNRPLSMTDPTGYQAQEGGYTPPLISGSFGTGGGRGGSGDGAGSGGSGPPCNAACGAAPPPPIPTLVRPASPSVPISGFARDVMSQSVNPRPSSVGEVPIRRGHEVSTGVEGLFLRNANMLIGVAVGTAAFATVAAAGAMMLGVGAGGAAGAAASSGVRAGLANIAGRLGGAVGGVLGAVRDQVSRVGSSIVNSYRQFEHANRWKEIREQMVRDGQVPPRVPVHHWGLAQVAQGGEGRLTLRGFFGEQYGRFVPNFIKNAGWNLMLPPEEARWMPMAQKWHDGLHGKGELALNLWGRLWYGTPIWFKFVVLGVPAGAGAATYALDE